MPDSMSRHADIHKWEDYGMRTLRGGKHTGHTPVSVRAMAERLLGKNPVAYDSKVIGSCYLQRCSDGGTQILLRRGPDIRFRIVRGLALFTILRDFPDRVFQYPELDVITNRIAASVLVPADEVRQACMGAKVGLHTAVGDHVAPLAKLFGVSRACMFLRIGEVFGDERAVMTRSGNVLVRSGGALDWSAIPVADVIAGRPWPGLASTRFTGADAGRFAVRAMA